MLPSTIKRFFTSWQRPHSFTTERSGSKPMRAVTCRSRSGTTSRCATDQVLRTVEAPAAEIAEAKRLYDEQRQSGLTAPAAVPAPAATPAPTPEPAADKPGKALRPWIEVALPHPDVLANRFKEAEFAAGRFAVVLGEMVERE
jgi:hypothetical protein